MRARPGPLVYGLLGLLALLWGIAFVGIKEALRELSPGNLTILRFAIADVCLLALIAVWPAVRPRFERADVLRLAVLGLSGVPGYHLALNYGEQRTTASVAALIVATAPVMVAAASTALLRERVTLARAAGIAMAFGGVALLAFAGEQEPGHAPSLPGILIALGAPLSWTVYTIAAKPLTARVSSIHITAASMLIGSLGLLPLVRADTVREIGGLGAATWGWMLLLGAGSSVVGYMIFVFALSRMDATSASVWLYPVPVVALVGAWAILGEPLGIAVGVAAALVVAGVALAQRPAPSAARPPEPRRPVAARE